MREQLARRALLNFRSKGHPYVELREDGKGFIFFCALCLAPCHSDSILLTHLQGNLHREMLSAAKATLFGPNPWPFNDGMHFFDTRAETDKMPAITDGNRERLFKYLDDNINLSIVTDVENSDHIHSGLDVGERNLNEDEGKHDMVIPGVRIKNNISLLNARFIGLGKIAVKFLDKDDVSVGVGKIWCEWLGEKDHNAEDIDEVSEHKFGVVTMAYSDDLARVEDDEKLALPSSGMEESKNGEGSTRKRKRSFSDPEDVSEAVSNQYDLSAEESTSVSSVNSSLLDQWDDRLCRTRSMSNKHVRRDLRQKQRCAAERMCDICQHKMLPGKDVATLVNMQTRKLACSTRNPYGIFHVFHTSCLILWILLCEYEMCKNQLDDVSLRQGTRRRRLDSIEVGKDGGLIRSVFCPECQGTGVNIAGHKRENPCVSMAKMFRSRIKLSTAHRAWRKSPETLQNCSLGFHFPSEETFEGKVKSLNLLRFFGADI